MKMKKLALAASVAITSMWSSHAAAAEIQFWHAFTGRLGELVAEQIEKFNASQDKHTVVGSHKGNYSETLNAGIAAFRAKEQPHILMVFEVGTATMMAAEGAVYPPLNTIRAVSLRIAVALARKAWEQGLATIDQPDDLEAHIEQMMYTPEYPDLAG